jgi:hypothetical protein
MIIPYLILMRFSLADIPTASGNVRFTPKSGHAVRLKRA